MKSSFPLERASLQVPEAVAEAEDVPITDLPPLWEFVDPDALDTIVESGGTVTFEYTGYTVTVSESEDISVEPA